MSLYFAQKYFLQTKRRLVLHWLSLRSLNVLAAISILGISSELVVAEKISFKSTTQPIEARSYIKPGAPVRIIAPDHIAVAENETVELDFIFNSRHYGLAELRVWSDEALSHDLPETMELDFSQGLITLPVTLSASKEGRHYLYMSVSINGKSRYISYGQTFGDEKMIASQRIVQKPAVDGIKRFKARETVRTK